MRTLLAVGEGSERESHVAIMKWNGGKTGDQPLAFIGKGVCFDTGGISLKPAEGMEEMKWDMGGAAAVSGLMCALAGRKAKVNVIGVIGLVENMPDGKAQRPGDVVTSLSGQTVEVINTDAEGRLVLGDCLWYVQEQFKPKFMIDLATLTGAMIVALGHEYAGVFANDDAVANAILAAGPKVDEPVWRMPLPDRYDRHVDSQIADMRTSATAARAVPSRRALSAAPREQDTMGPHRHRAHRLGEGLEEPDGAGRRRRLRRASAGPHGRGFVRSLT